MPSIHQDQLRKWQLMGAEPVFERGTCRLAPLKKSFGRDVVVTAFDKETTTYRPVILSDGEPLMAHEVLPERADLALDAEGHLLNQGEFSQNYEKFLDSYIYPNGSNPRDEPVPNVVAFVKEMPDKWSDSPGMVEIRFDPKLNEPFRPQQRYGPNGESEEEWKREQAKQGSDTASVLKQLAETQALLATLIAGKQPAAPVAEFIVEVPVMTTAEAVEATSEDSRDQAKCGKYVAKGYVKQHERRCADPACGDGSVNSVQE